jgi:lysophospholipase L1-like esterase
MLLALVLVAPIVISAVDPHIRYVGRWDYTDPHGPRCEWTASTVEIRFHGPELDADLAPSQAYLITEVDGAVGDKFQPSQGGRVTLASGLSDGHHVVRLIRETEAFGNPSQMLDFILPSGGLDKARAAPHRLEVIGDSISCGYGNEGANEKEHFKPETENAYLTYGAIAARKVNADYTCIAWSGRKLWPDNTIPSIYDLTLPTDQSSQRNVGPAMDAVLINLATNDFGRGIPDESGWTGAYSKFIGTLRQASPRARIYLAMGPMMSDAYPPKLMEMTVLRKYLNDVIDQRKAAGDTDIAIIDFGTQDAAKNGLGADWHPNVKTHEIMGQQLAGQLHTDLRW